MNIEGQDGGLQRADTGGADKVGLVGSADPDNIYRRAMEQQDEDDIEMLLLYL